MPERAPRQPLIPGARVYAPELKKLNPSYVRRSRITKSVTKANKIMARKRHKSNETRQDRYTTIMNFARVLNLHSLDAYQDWCLQHGFSTTLNKTRVQLEREHQILAAVQMSSPVTVDAAALDNAISRRGLLPAQAEGRRDITRSSWICSLRL